MSLIPCWPNHLRRSHARTAGQAITESVIAILFLLILTGYGMDFLFLALGINAMQAAATEAAVAGAEASTSFNNADVGFGTLASSSAVMALPSAGGADPDSQAAGRATALLGPLMNLYESPQISLTREVSVSGGRVQGDYRTRINAEVRLILPFPGVRTVSFNVGAEQRYRPAVIQRAS